MSGKTTEVKAAVPITDMKEGEMVGNVSEDNKTRNGQPSDQLTVNFFSLLLCTYIGKLK